MAHPIASDRLDGDNRLRRSLVSGQSAARSEYLAMGAASRLTSAILLIVMFEGALTHSSVATTKGLSQIVTPDLQPAGDLSLSFQWQSHRIANPYELQSELGLTKWAEFAVFKGFDPNEVIFGTEIGLIQKEP